MNRNKTVLLGMSGGVDSSVAALILKNKGYRVIGIFFKMYSDSKDLLTGECSYVQDKKDAQRIADLLGIEIIFEDYEKEYKKGVLNPMFEEYSKGRTPNPDILCNSVIKFPILWAKAKEIGADLISTGHYARIKKTGSRFQLLSGIDMKKDQSYFLSRLTQFDLSHTLFPIGDLTKEEVRKIAKKNGFLNWDKHGSVGICFVGETNMQSFLEKRIPPKPGKVIILNKKVVGVHKGLSFYTIGQKAGPKVGIDMVKPSGFESKKFYVSAKLKNNTIMVALEGDKSLEKRKIFLKNFKLVDSSSFKPGKGLFARIRHLGELHRGNLVKEKNGRISFLFRKPVRFVAEGQYLVAYSKDRVVGSGEIRII